MRHSELIRNVLKKSVQNPLEVFRSGTLLVLDPPRERVGESSHPLCNHSIHRSVVDLALLA